ncbi:nidogen-like isoform X2 [Macrobrachium nipponense]|uniref:nidogen-like isoform X2 n=1 Tax=Macrobrachium nipponense TaxID=159736 RepID=UPI0030C8538C
MKPFKDLLVRSLLLWASLGVLRPSGAVPKSEFFRFGERAGDNKLLNKDDFSTTEIRLQVPLIFYGQIYESLFVNINGFVSFLTEIPNFFNVQFPLEYPIIAPFYSDVDITRAGNIWYRETSDPRTVTRAKNELKKYFGVAEGFNPEGIFIVTWDGVGAFSQRADRLNTYQLILATDGKESYAIFKYADGGIQWLQSDGKDPNMADARGQAGLISGDGRHLTLKGSGTDQVRSLDKWSNTGVPGLWVYRIGQIALDENVQEPDLVSEDKAEESCASSGSVCHSNAICKDYDRGFCCSCQDGYFGNGINCLKKEEPLRVTGKVSGTVNGMELKDADLHSYVLTVEGRTYTAISRMPSQIGYDIQSITVFGTGIAWLFAKAVGDVPNGFALTGAMFTRTAEVDFPQTGHHLFVHQRFKGLDVFNSVQVNTEITGSVPTVPLGSKIEMDAFNEEYTRVKPGQIRARSSRVFRLQGQTIDTPFTVETTIDFDECRWRPKSNDLNTVRLKVAENIFIQYDAPEQIVRYALSAKVAPLEETDPCVEGRQECGQNSQCVVDGDTFRCVCERGYEEVYDATLNEAICLDINECDTGRDNCHLDAICVNSPGSFACTCRHGFTGDGFTCTREASCEGVPCDPNAVCDLRGTVPRCTCRPGFTGDGFFCSKDQGGPSVDEQRDCIDNNICSPYADCLYDDAVRGFRCACFPGYSGDGETCTPDGQRESCGTARNCSPYGVCSKKNTGYVCECLPGFTGDGYTCDVSSSVTLPPLQPPYQPEDPYPPYHHTPDDSRLPYETPQEPYPQDPYQQPGHRRPRPPYQQPDDTYDTYQRPEEIPEYPLPEEQQPGEGQGSDSGWSEPQCLFGACWCPGTLQYNIIHNRCEPSSSQRSVGEIEARPLPSCFAGKCICTLGYAYDNLRHECRADHTPGYDYSIKGGGHRVRASCNEINTCHPNAQCVYQPSSKSYSCVCDVGYEGDGHSCSSKIDISCDKVNICHFNAQCVYDDAALQHVCVCQQGYQGDGLVCTPQDECSSIQDCDVNAQCLYESVSRRYKCQCNSGFEGDGRTCTPERAASCNIVNNCHNFADCIYDTYALRYRCQCRAGYEGDGTFCNPTQVGCNVVHNCGDNAECAYDLTASGYRCKCREGFSGDGFFCRSSRSCREDPSVCHPQASCQPDALSSFGVACKCLDGFTGDGYTCQEAPDHEKYLLLINQGLSVLRMPSDPRSGAGFPIHVEPFMTAVGADVDCLAGRYYWTDVRSSSIRSSKYDGRERKPVISGGNIGSPEDVAVDWVSGNVYWTDSENDVVAVASIKKGKIRTVVKGDLVNPRGIAVHPGRGLLFWSDWNREGAKIEVSGLDGSHRRKLVEKDIMLPNSLVIDYDLENLCWADAGTHKIECVNLDGNERRVVMTEARYPFGLTILGQDFYYTDWNDTKIHTVDRYSGFESGARDPPLGGSGKLYGIAAVPPSCPPVANVCGADGGNCPESHLCLPNGRGGRTCACTDDALENKEEGPCNDYNY